MQLYPTLEQAKSYTLGGEYKSIPISTSIDICKSTQEIYKTLKNVSKNVFLLESCEDTKKFGRYSFFGFDPSLEITCKDSFVTIKSSTTHTFENVKPHKFIRQIIAENKAPQIEGLPPFTGGLVGYFAYEFMKYSEQKLDLPIKNEDGFNDVDLMLFTKVIAVDNLENKVILIVNVKTDDLETNYNNAMLQLESLKNLIENGSLKNEQQGKLLTPLKAQFNEQQFCEIVEKAKRHIFEGDIFQVVLSNMLEAGYEGSLFNVYENLKASNPSPYMFYFSSDDVEIAGASPETLVKLEGEKVVTYPLAGTRKRGKSEAEDIALEKELLADEKETSEHNMLVDLGRNDIGKVSKFGTVKVDEYMKVLKFSHVMHIGSIVSGAIRDDLDYLDAIDSVLPAGTLSGAPKVRACEIIHDLENLKRGIYGGAIGYIDFSGNMDTCIAIRLAFKKNDKIFVRSGAGIVYDSVPESEYAECINKAKAVVTALEA